MCMVCVLYQVSYGQTEDYSQEKLIIREGKQFKKRGFEYMVYDIETELLKDALLFKTPVVRNGRLATVGYQPELWKEWIKEQ